MIELLVVIAIIAILAALLMPALKTAKDEARKIVCMSQVKQLTLAAAMYVEDHNQFFPFASIGGVAGGDRWYQISVLGPYFNQDLPKITKPDGVNEAPPQGSLIDCPSRALEAGAYEEKTWISMNAQWQNGSTTCVQYQNGPSLKEFKRADKVVVFEDSTSWQFQYTCNWTGATWVTTNLSDYRHNRGVNYGFADAHADFFKNPNDAYLGGELKTRVDLSR